MNINSKAEVRMFQAPPPRNCVTALVNRFAYCVVCNNQIIIQNHKRDGEILALILQHPHVIQSCLPS